VFSVCQKGRGGVPAQLDFVELVPTDTAIATGDDGATLLTRINLGRCFLPSCRQQGQRSSGNNNGGASEQDSSAANNDNNNDNINVCVHVKLAMECQNRASPLTLKSSVLEGLPAPVEVRDEIWRLATETPGPLVQRVSADRLVVKCHVDGSHPLGLLHLTIGAGAGSSTAGKRRRDGSLAPPVQRRPQQQQQEEEGEVFRCSCQVSSSSSSGGGGSRKGKGSSSQPLLGPVSGGGGSEACLHFYACVCALASDEQLASDFATFINYSPKGIEPKF